MTNQKFRDETREFGCMRKKPESIRLKSIKIGTYGVWSNMKIRCKDKQNKNYGGRGIKVCARWEKFSNFLEDMGHKPKGKSLDRIDGSKGYFKSNCRWATSKQQNNNKKNNIILNVNGKSKRLIDWLNIKKMKRTTLLSRLNRGWDSTEAVNFKVRKRYGKNGKIKINGEYRSLSEWAKKINAGGRTLNTWAFKDYKMCVQKIKKRLNKISSSEE